MFNFWGSLHSLPSLSFIKKNQEAGSLLIFFMGSPKSSNEFFGETSEPNARLHFPAFQGLCQLVEGLGLALSADFVDLAVNSLIVGLSLYVADNT